MHLRLDGPSCTTTSQLNGSRGVEPQHGGVAAELVITRDGIPMLLLRDNHTFAERDLAARWMDTLIFRDRVLARPVLSVN